MLRHAAVLLRCEGLDTVASLELNGAPVGAAANAHRTHAWDVTQLLAEGSNRLAVTFEPAPNFAAARRDAYPYPMPHTQQVGAVPGYNFIRKAARWAPRVAAPWIGCSPAPLASGWGTAPTSAPELPTVLLPCSYTPRSDFGWDWGPAFPIAGITGWVELVGRSTAVLTGGVQHCVAPASLSVPFSLLASWPAGPASS